MVISQYFEAPVRRVARRRVEPHFDSLFTSRNEVRRLRAQVKNCRKNLSETILQRVARQISCEMRLCQDWRPQNGPQELSRDPCEDSWGPLGCSWGHIEKLSRRSWRSWSTLGALFARSWRALGTSWTRLEGCWTLQNALRSIFVLPKSIWDPSGADFDHSENGLGGSKRGFSQPTCICVNLHVRMHIMLNNSQLIPAMPYIPKFAVILSSLCSVIPAQGRRSREASSIST